MMGSNGSFSVLLAALMATACLSAAPPEEPEFTVGWQKQLFLDDWVVDSTQNVSRVLKEPQRWPGNPVIIGDKPWEKWTAYLNGRGILYDDDDRLFKTWYLSPTFDDAVPSGLRYKVCYAFSEDGVRWTKPDLGLVEWAGSRANNILPWGQHWMRRPNVIRDPRDPDPQRRFKMLYTDVVGDWPRTDYRQLAGITKATSPDGINWQHNVDLNPWRPGGNGTNVLGWDPAAEKYVVYIRMYPPGILPGGVADLDFPLHQRRFSPVVRAEAGPGSGARGPGLQGLSGVDLRALLRRLALGLERPGIAFRAGDQPGRRSVAADLSGEGRVPPRRTRYVGL